MGYHSLYLIQQLLNHLFPNLRLPLLVSGVSRTGTGPEKHELEQDEKPGHSNMEHAQTHACTHPNTMVTHLESTGIMPQNHR